MQEMRKISNFVLKLVKFSLSTVKLNLKNSDKIYEKILSKCERKKNDSSATH